MFNQASSLPAKCKHDPRGNNRAKNLDEEALKKNKKEKRKTSNKYLREKLKKRFPKIQKHKGLLLGESQSEHFQELLFQHCAAAPWDVPACPSSFPCSGNFALFLSIPGGYPQTEKLETTSGHVQRLKKDPIHPEEIFTMWSCSPG